MQTSDKVSIRWSHKCETWNYIQQKCSGWLLSLYHNTLQSQNLYEDSFTATNSIQCNTMYCIIEKKIKMYLASVWIGWFVLANDCSLVYRFDHHHHHHNFLQYPVFDVCGSILYYTIRLNLLAFWWVVICDLLEDRSINDITVNFFS